MLYASRSRHGVWRYRRAIPEPLWRLAGKREYTVSLRTRDDAEATQRHAKVHLDAERQFKLWRAQASGVGEQTTEEDEWAKGREFLKLNRLDYIPFERLKGDHKSQATIESEYDQRLAFVDSQLGINTYDEETRDEAIEASLKARAVLGVLRPPVLRLSSALRLYLEEKAADLSQKSERAARGFRLEKERVIAGLRKALGEDRPIEKLVRADALTYRDFLLNNCNASASTVNKYIRVAHTIVGNAITHHDLRVQNPFRSLRIADGIPDKERRPSLSADEINLLLSLRERLNEELADILTLLICTGARLKEIAGLEIEEVQPDRKSKEPPYLWIRPNRTRGLKSKSSRRKVPLVGPGIHAAIDALARATTAGRAEGPLFPRYGRNGGSDAGSAALMKYLRRVGITDKRKVIHSIRHSVKLALRNVGCPKDLRDAIQGHTAGDVAETYGSGFGLESMRDWLTKALPDMGVEVA
jgi:integrase